MVNIDAIILCEEEGELHGPSVLFLANQLGKLNLQLHMSIGGAPKSTVLRKLATSSGYTMILERQT
jgi:hypothetical protein